MQEPLNVEIRVLNSGESRVLDNVMPNVFDNPIAPDRTATSLADARHHLAVALDRDLVVGMASAVDYLHPDKPPELWINEIGGAPSHQRRGIGRALLQALFDLAHELGCRDAWLITDSGNEPAQRLYAAHVAFACQAGTRYSLQAAGFLRHTWR